MAVYNLGSSIAVQIPTGATGISTPFDMDSSQSIVAIFVPTGWISAAITFQASIDNGSTWFDVYDSTMTEYTVSSITSGKTIIFNPLDFVAFTKMRIRSGTGASPVNQTSAPTLSVIIRVI